MKRIIFGIMFLVLVGSVFAAEMDLEALNKELAGNTIPKPLDKLFGDEKINIHFDLENGEKSTLGLTTDNNKFQALTVGELEDASLNVYTSEKVAKKIESANNPTKAIKEAFNNKEITYKAVGIVNKIKFMFLSLIISMAGGFDGEEVADEPEEIIEEEKDEIVEDEVDVEEEEEETDEDESEEEEEEEIIEEEPTGPKTHIVNLINTGFDNSSINIKVGDTVEWHNVRTGNTNKGMIIGTQKCSEIKSSIYVNGEHFGWTFDEAMTCTVVDGIFSTQTMKIVVE